MNFIKLFYGARFWPMSCHATILYTLCDQLLEMCSSEDWLGRIDVGTKGLVLAPVNLPFFFNGLVIVEFGHGPDERSRAMFATRLG